MEEEEPIEDESRQQGIKESEGDGYGDDDGEMSDVEEFVEDGDGDY